MVWSFSPKYKVRRGEKVFPLMTAKELVHKIETTNMGFAIEVLDRKSRQWTPLQKHLELASMVAKRLRNFKNSKKKQQFFFWPLVCGLQGKKIRTSQFSPDRSVRAAQSPSGR